MTVATPPGHGEALPAEAEAAGWDVDDDALVQGLAWLTRHHGRERSPASLLAGQPFVGRPTPAQALRVLGDAGFEAGLIERRIDAINPLLLPALLLMRDGGACILRRVLPAAGADPQGAAEATAEIVVPGRTTVTRQLPLSELQAAYAGHALVATPRAAPAAAGDDHAPDPRRHWFWGVVRRFVPYYRSAMLAALMSNLLMLVSGIVVSVVYDKVIPNQAMTTLWTLATASAMAIGFDLVARQLRAYLIDTAGKKADLMVGAALFRQSLGVRLEHRPESSGAYSHVLAQVEMVREFFSSATLSAISDLPFIALFIAMAFVIGGPLGWVLVIAVPLVLLVSVVIQGVLRRAMSDNMRQHADLHGVLVEAVDGLEDVKATGAQGRFLRLYEDVTSAAAESSLRARRVGSLSINLTGIAQQSVTLVILVWGVHLIHAQVLTGGALIGAVMFATRAIAPLHTVVNLASRYQAARAAMLALERVMRQPLEREPGRAYLPQRELGGHIALRDVGFAYPAAPGTTAPDVLQQMNLEIRPGERVAVLGRIGSGKSTLLRLLAGLYQPLDGRVEVDGIDLRQIDPADFRARVGFVAQDPRLFNGTLRDNVLLDRPAADPARLAEVAELTGLARVAAAHPLGWERPVGESGHLLSGGQRQLVALARCLITRPRILLLDEPTSSMDAQSEIQFLRQLQRACGDCTLVMVTHRPALLEMAQRLVVVDGGRIVMDGPKARVLAALSGRGPAAAGTAGGAMAGAAANAPAAAAAPAAPAAPAALADRGEPAEAAA